MFFFLYSYFEAMFRSFMPEDNTVTVSKIGKTELLFSAECTIGLFRGLLFAKALTQ